MCLTKNCIEHVDVVMCAAVVMSCFYYCKLVNRIECNANIQKHLDINFRVKERELSSSFFAKQKMYTLAECNKSNCWFFVVTEEKVQIVWCLFWMSKNMIHHAIIYNFILVLLSICKMSICKNMFNEWGRFKFEKGVFNMLLWEENNKTWKCVQFLSLSLSLHYNHSSFSSKARGIGFSS